MTRRKAPAQVKKNWRDDWILKVGERKQASIVFQLSNIYGSKLWSKRISKNFTESLQVPLFPIDMDIDTEDPVSIGILEAVAVDIIIAAVVVTMETVEVDISIYTWSQRSA
jgi:hypothetical protein